MSGYVGGQKELLCKGDLHPASWYRGSNKIDGYKSLEQTGTSLAFADTYNDTVQGLSVFGKSQQVAGVKGTNLISNGDFSNGTTGWGGVTSIVDGRACKLATYQYSNIHQAKSSVVGHVYYFSCYLKADSGVYFGNLGSGVALSLSYDGQKSVVKTATTTSINWGVGDSRTSGWTEMLIDNVVVIDLTAEFGAGNEPTAAQMDAMLAQYPNSWFNGANWLTTNATYTPNSPSPDYPSPIVSVGETNGVTVTATDGDTQSVSATRSVVLRSLPDGTRDAYNPITGEVQRNVAVKVFDGTETLYDDGYLNEGYNYAYISLGAAPNTATICTHFKDRLLMSPIPAIRRAESSWITAVLGITLADSRTGIVSTDTKSQQRMAKIKSYLAAQYAAGTPVTVQYELATPTTETVAPITLPTYPGQTHLDAGGAELTATCRVVDI